MRTAIDLFCGAGGLSEGFSQAGYSIVAGSDWDAASGETYVASHPDSKFILSPIQDLTAQMLMNTAGIKRGELDVLLGGPPCQAYSVNNHQRGMHDQRASLFKEYIRIIKGVFPKWVVMENVTGITSIAGGRVVEEIKQALNSLGYTVDYRMLKAEEFGVPQERRRVFFIANRVGAPIVFPAPTHGPNLKPYTTISDAIGDLPRIVGGVRAVSLPYARPAEGAFQKYVRSSKDKAVFNHEAPKLSSINLQRMKHIPQGGSWRDIPHALLPEGMKRAKRSDHTKRYGRLKPNGLSGTILTKCDIHWGAYIHPDDDRAISVREAARIQSFPDSFLFKGSRTEQYMQVGNAVPPLLAKNVALAIEEAIAQVSIKASVRSRKAA